MKKCWLGRKERRKETNRQVHLTIKQKGQEDPISKFMSFLKTELFSASTDIFFY